MKAVGRYFQVGVYFFSLFSVMIFLVPLILKDISLKSFYISEVVSFLIMGLTFRLWKSVFKVIDFHKLKRLWLWMGIIFAGMNIMYVSNVIPPIPLALKSDSVYYHVERKSEGYQVIRPLKKWYERLWPVVYIDKPEGEWIYYYSAVFAPSKFKEPVLHVWELKEDSGFWKRIYQQPLNIYGGRDGGFRAYSYLVNPKPGKIPS